MSVWMEMRRRKVFKVAAVYILVAWVIVQVVTVISEPLQLPDWFDTVVILLLGVGLPLSMVFAWAYETIPEFTHDRPRAENLIRTYRKFPVVIHSVITCILVVAVIWLTNTNYAEKAQADGASLLETVAAMEQLKVERDAPDNTLLVLPFDNLSPDADTSDFIAGMHLELTRRLSRIDELAVVDATSALKSHDPLITTRQLGRMLNTRTLLETSISMVEQQIVIRAILVDAQTGGRLWIGRYDCESEDFTTYTTDIIQQISTALNIELSAGTLAGLRRPITPSPVAREMFLRAQAATADQRYAVALEFLNRALTADPDFSEAYALKAEHYARIAIDDKYSSDSEEETPSHELALSYATRALELNTDAGRAWHARAMIFEKFWLWNEAKEAYKKASNLHAVDTDRYARFLANNNRHEEAVAIASQQLARNPLAANAFHTMAFVQSTGKSKGDSEMALAALESAARLDPNNAEYHLLKALILIAATKNSDAEDSLRTFEKLLDESEREKYLPRLAYAYAALNSDDDIIRLQNEYMAHGISSIDPASEALLLFAFDNTNAKNSLASAVDQVAEYRAGPDVDSLMLIMRNYAELKILATRDIDQQEERLEQLLARS